MNLIRNTLSRFVSSGQIAGCAVRVMRKDEVVFEGSFGYADIERKVEMSSENTIFPIASMSKVVTVAGMMQLYERGLFKMWDPVSEYLPGFNNPKVALFFCLWSAKVPSSESLFQLMMRPGKANIIEKLIQYLVQSDAF